MYGKNIVKKYKKQTSQGRQGYGQKLLMEKLRFVYM